MPGPPPTPSKVNALHGWPGKRARNRQEPEPLPASLLPPRYLPRAARAIWRDLVPELARLGLLTILDVRSFATACRLQAEGERLLRAVERHRRIVLSDLPQGIYAAPKYLEKAQALFARFGLTPADRVRLHAPQPDAPPAPKGQDDDRPRPASALARLRDRSLRPA